MHPLDLVKTFPQRNIGIISVIGHAMYDVQSTKITPIFQGKKEFEKFQAINKN